MRITAVKLKKTACFKSSYVSFVLNVCNLLLQVEGTEVFRGNVLALLENLSMLDKKQVPEDDKLTNFLAKAPGE